MSARPARWTPSDPATGSPGGAGPAAPEGEPVRPSLGAQAVWLLTAKTVGFALAIALPLVLVRRMAQEEFGLYKQVFLVVGTAVNILPLGFGMSAFYFLPRERGRQGAIVINIVLFHAAMGLLIALLLMARPDVLAWVFNNPELTLHARLIAVVVLLWTIGSFLEIVPVALQDVRASTGLIIISQFSKTGLLLVAAVGVGTVDALIVAAMAHGLVQIALMLAYLHRRFPGFWHAFDARLLWRQAAYAVPVGASGLLLKLQEDVHHAFVSNAFGPAVYAIYAVGVFKLPLIGMLRESVGSVVLPRINELETRNERRQILELVAATARKLALVYFPIYALLMVTGREVISTLFTTQYVESWPIFAISLSVVPFGVIVLDPVTRAHSERYFFLAVRAVIFSVLVAVLWQYAAVLGLRGAIGAVVVAHLTGWSIAVTRMARLLHMERRDLALFADLARIAVVSAIAAGVTSVVHASVAELPALPTLLVCAPVFGLLYAALVVWARVLQREEVSQLLRDVGRSVGARRVRVRPGAAPGAAPAADSPVVPGR